MGNPNEGLEWEKRDLKEKHMVRGDEQDIKEGVKGKDLRRKDMDDGKPWREPPGPPQDTSTQCDLRFSESSPSQELVLNLYTNHRGSQA